MELESKGDESRVMRAGTREDWRGTADTEETAKESQPSDEVPGTQQRGTMEDPWRRATPGDVSESTGDAESTADESTEPETGDSQTQKENVTFRDGALRD